MLFICTICYAEIVQDNVASLLPAYVKDAETYENYNFESTEKVSIKLKPIEDVKSELELMEGAVVKFKVIKNVVYNNNIVVRRGTIVPSTVQLIISTGMNGIPASIVVGDFKIDGIKSGQLTNNYEFVGQDRSLLVFPLKWALTPLPPTGSLTNFIKGGHAKIKIKKPIEIFYHPHWS